MLPASGYTTFAALLVLAAELPAQDARIDGARQFNAANATQVSTFRPGAPAGSTTPRDQTEESFGVQELLREGKRTVPFRAFADISAFVTNNAALTQRNRKDDTFLVATFGFEYRRDLPGGFQIEASVQYAAFRYNQVQQLDFDSLDAGIGLNYHSAKLGGVDLFVRYNFNELISSGDNRAFFNNHTVTVAAQKSVPLGKAQSAYAGVSGQIAWSDPKIAERSECWAYAGYHVRATSRLEGDLQYRYGYLNYGEQDRADNYNALSVSVRYRFTDWFAASVSSYAGWNRSDIEVSNYDAANVGGGLTVSVQF
jgi:hypothetical protein